MPGSDYTPLESLSAKVTEERPAELGVHAIIEEAEQLIRVVGNTAVFEYHRLIQLMAELKNHPHIKNRGE